MSKLTVTKLEEYKEKFVQNSLKENKDADKSVLYFIADFLYCGSSEEEALCRANILYRTFRCGYCYYFAHMLKNAFQHGEVCWAVSFGHFIWQYNEVQYDIEGVYCGEATMFIPELYMGETINDFRHIRNNSHNTTAEEMSNIIKLWTNRNEEEM